MFTLRSEVSTVVSACEHLISETMVKGHIELTDEECQVLDYYAGELLKVTQIEPAVEARSAWRLDPLLTLVRSSGPLETTLDDIQAGLAPGCTPASRPSTF